MHQPSSNAEGEICQVKIEEPLVSYVGLPGWLIEEEAFVGQHADHKDYLVENLDGKARNKQHNIVTKMKST